nr:reverse transcriptase domain-containing protein [Tanacetum cinerariifolium]
MMTSDQFFGLEKDNPHDHIRWFNKITSTIKYKATPPLASVKAVEEICVACGGGHPYYQCLAADGNTFLELRDNIQGYVVAVAVNYNQGNFGYRLSGVDDQIQPSGFAQPNVENNQNRFSQPQGYNQGNNFNQDQSYQASTQQNQVVPLSSGSLLSNTIANPKGELKAITTRSGIVLNGPFVPIPPPFINPEEDEPLLSNKEKLLELANTPLNENCLAVILKKLPEKHRDPRKFLISCGFSELKCKALADLGASINLMSLSIWKKLGLPKLISTRMTLELANRVICTLTGNARDVFVLVSKFIFLADFIIIDYESNPRVALILGRPFLRTARALIDVNGKEMILQSINMINSYDDSSEDFLEDLFATNHQSVPLLYLPFDIESDLKEIEYLLHHDPIKEMDSILKDSIVQSNFANLNENLADTIPEMYTKEHALDYSSPLLYDEYDDDFIELKSGDFLPSSEYASFLIEDFSEVDAFPSTNNEDNVFNPGILIQENHFKVTTRIAPDKNVKKLAISHASLILEDFDHPLYELPFFKEVPSAETLLLFSSENEEKVFKPGILTSKEVHSFLIPKLSHR